MAKKKLDWLAAEVFIHASFTKWTELINISPVTLLGSAATNTNRLSADNESYLLILKWT